MPSPSTTTPRTTSRATEGALRRIVEGTAGTTGREFFRAFSRHLAGVLGYRYAMVAELVSPKPARLHTLAVWDEESDTDAVGRGIGSGVGSGIGLRGSCGMLGGRRSACGAGTVETPR